MAVLDPVKLVITNYPDGKSNSYRRNNPEDPDQGSRLLPFSNTLYIERMTLKKKPIESTFVNPRQRGSPKNAYIIKGTDVVKDADGNIIKYTVPTIKTANRARYRS